MFTLIFAYFLSDPSEAIRWDVLKKIICLNSTCKCLIHLIMCMYKNHMLDEV